MGVANPKQYMGSRHSRIGLVGELIEWVSSIKAGEAVGYMVMSILFLIS